MSETAARRRRAKRPSRRAMAAASLAVMALAVALFVAVRSPRKVTAAAPTPAGAPATVTVDSAEVKSQASATARTVATLPRGTRLEIEKDLGLWTEIRSKAGAGYLPADAFERDTDRDARKRRAGTVLSFSPVAGLVVEDAPLRLAPFPMAPRAGRLEKGATVRIYAVDHDYYTLQGSDGGLAFVESASVDVIPPDPAQPSVVPVRERALKDLQVTELAQPLPLPAGEEPPVESPGAEPSDARAPAPALEEPVEPASLLTKVEPVYPELARRSGAEGTVLLDATIGVDGKVSRVDVVRGLPFGLSEAASSAVSHWRYKPARGRSGPIVSRKQVRIDFRLKG